MTQDIVILGSTGSIGTQTLEVVQELNDSGKYEFNVIGLSCGGNVDLLSEQIRTHSPNFVAAKGKTERANLESTISSEVECLSGTEGLIQLATLEEADLVVNALVGFVGLEPTLRAAERGTTVLLANKESLVVGGSLVTEALRENNSSLVPIDSEHSAIFQSLRCGEDSEVERLILTASGGPFRDTPVEEIESAGPGKALDHPNWSMGNRITIDSATMVNKAFEVIEAHWLFDIPLEMIYVLIHHQSIIHSMVEYQDGSIIAQMGPPDMKGPIQYALTQPRRVKSNSHRLDLEDLTELTFQPVEGERYPAYGVLISAARKGGNRPAALNSADEELIEAFLEEKIPFGGIAKGLEMILDSLPAIEDPTLDELKETDRWSRERVQKLIQNDQL